MISNRSERPLVFGELSHMYVRRAYFAFVRQTVAKALRPNTSERAYAVFAPAATFDGIIYSALAAESYINKLGLLACAPDEFNERGLTVRQKWIKVHDWILGRRPDEKSPFFRDTMLLFDQRNMLVHDRPRLIENESQLDAFRSERAIGISAERAFEILLAIDERFSGYRADGHSVPLVNGLYRTRWDKWSKPADFQVVPPLPFAGARFPDQMEYESFYHFQLGTDPPRIQVDSVTKTIGAT